MERSCYREDGQQKVDYLNKEFAKRHAKKWQMVYQCPHGHWHIAKKSCKFRARKNTRERLGAALEAFAIGCKSARSSP
jgi:hypothetical protein